MSDYDPGRVKTPANPDAGCQRRSKNRPCGGAKVCRLGWARSLPAAPWFLGPIRASMRRRRVAKASGQITMRRVDGWQTLDQAATNQPLDLAA